MSTNPDATSSRTYAATSLGSMGSTSAASSQVMGGGIRPGMGLRSKRRRCRMTLRSPGRLPRALGVELDRGHGPVPDAAQLRCRRQRGAGDRPAGHAGAGGERLAARVAPRARSGAHAAVPAVSQAHAPALSDAGRNREGRSRDLADLDGVPERPPHPARHAAARRRRQPVVHALSRRLQHRHQHHLFGRRQGILSAAAGHSAAAK